MDNNEITKKSIHQAHILTRTALICFWLHIANYLFSNVGIPLSLLVSGIHAVLMLRLGSVDPHFRTAGMVEAVSIVARLLIPTLPAGIWDILRDVGIHGLNLLWAYHVFTGFSKALAETHPHLSDKWRSNRNWYLCANAVAETGIILYSYVESLPKLIPVLAIFVSVFMEITICINYWKTANIGKS